jgi:hypothetical protein
MRWHTAFPEPITLKDGSVLVSLGEAGRYILGLPDSLRDTLTWRHAAALLIKAAHTTAPADVFIAMMQMRRALLDHGLI